MQPSLDTNMIVTICSSLRIVLKKFKKPYLFPSKPIRIVDNQDRDFLYSFSYFSGVSRDSMFFAWKPYCPVLSATARRQTDGSDVSVLE